MLALHELQSRMARALLGHEPLPSEWFVEEKVPTAVRLGIHRNNIFLSLKDVLRKTFPAVCRVVDERFFFYATDVFIRHQPPYRAYLAAYGHDFARFLRSFPACHGLPYLPDLARFEWLLHRAAHADSPQPLAANALGGVPRKELPALRLSFAPSFGFLRSVWPIDRIWRANIASPEGETLDLDGGGVSLEIHRIDDQVVFRPLPPGCFAFRLSLHSGCSLQVASSLARTADARFDLAAALINLFREQALVSFSAAPTDLGQPPDA